MVKRGSRDINDEVKRELAKTARRLLKYLRKNSRLSYSQLSKEAKIIATPALVKTLGSGWGLPPVIVGVRMAVGWLVMTDKVTLTKDKYGKPDYVSLQ